MNFSWNPISYMAQFILKRKFPQYSQEHSQESKPQGSAENFKVGNGNPTINCENMISGIAKPVSAIRKKSKTINRAKLKHCKW